MPIVVQYHACTTNEKGEVNLDPDPNPNPNPKPRAL
jgi:hypothetical protein